MRERCRRDRSTVRVIAQNGTASDKVYTINYECDQKLVENIDFPNEAVKAQYNGKYTYFPAVEKGFAPYCDRGAVTVISDEIIGKPYIQAVSYTHLDVYTRQGQIHVLLYMLSVLAAFSVFCRRYAHKPFKCRKKIIIIV